MARSPHSRCVVADALKEAGIDGDWEYLYYNHWRFNARNSAYFYFDAPDGIFFYGREEKARKELVRPIWSYKLPKPPRLTKAYIKKLEAEIPHLREEFLGQDD